MALSAFACSGSVASESTDSEKAVPAQPAPEPPPSVLPGVAETPAPIGPAANAPTVPPSPIAPAEEATNPASPPPLPEGPNNPAAPAETTPQAPAQAATPFLGEASLILLTRERYAGSLSSLFGEDSLDHVELPTNTRLNGLSVVGARELALPVTATELYEANAFAITDWIFSDAERVPTVLGCSSAEACTAALLGNFGARIFRRPLSSEERTRYEALAALASSTLPDLPWVAPRHVLAAQLQSPSFLYQSQLGTLDPGSARHRLSQHELASRLAYLLTDAPPDEALWQAAQAGTLTAELGAHAERLLALPAGEAALGRFFEEYLGVADVDGLHKDPEAFPDYDTELAAAMKQETRRFMRSIALDPQRSFVEIFTADQTFVNSRLAELYGLPTPDSNWQAVAFPADARRPGVLGHASLLATHAHGGETSPTLRGKFVREALLCQVIPAPPPGVDTELEPSTAMTGTANAPTTKRAQLNVHSENPSCAGCHSLIDPIGLALEHFDAIGRFRDNDQGQTIDASGMLDGVAFDDALGLGYAIAAHPRTLSCLTRVWLRQVMGNLESPDEESLVNSLSLDLESRGGAFRQLAMMTVAHPAFGYVRPFTGEEQ